MNKSTFLIPIIAIIMGCLGALASRTKQDCIGVPQFYYDGTTYHAAGTLGKDYMCISGTTTCTYIAVGNLYQPCQSGTYTPFHAAPKKKQ